MLLGNNKVWNCHEIDMLLSYFRHKKTAKMRLLFYTPEQINDLGNQVGALREIRTPDPLVRSQVLYPAEL